MVLIILAPIFKNAKDAGRLTPGTLSAFLSLLSSNRWEFQLYQAIKQTFLPLVHCSSCIVYSFFSNDTCGASYFRQVIMRSWSLIRKSCGSWGYSFSGQRLKIHREPFVNSMTPDLSCLGLTPATTKTQSLKSGKPSFHKLTDPWYLHNIEERSKTWFWIKNAVIKDAAGFYFEYKNVRPVL